MLTIKSDHLIAVLDYLRKSNVTKALCFFFGLMLTKVSLDPDFIFSEKLATNLLSEEDTEDLEDVIDIFVEIEDCLDFGNEGDQEEGIKKVQKMNLPLPESDFDPLLSFDFLLKKVNFLKDDFLASQNFLKVNCPPPWI